MTGLVLMPRSQDPPQTTTESKLICKSKETLFKFKLGPSMCPTQLYDWRALSPFEVLFLP